MILSYCFAAWILGITTGYLIHYLVWYLPLDSKFRTLGRAAVKLDDELARYQNGLLTPEEFQNLCHNLHELGRPCSREEFEAGCKAFQDRLFGNKE